METYPRAAVERAMKIQELILRAVAKKITWRQAGEIIGPPLTQHNKLILPFPQLQWRSHGRRFRSRSCHPESPRFLQGVKDLPCFGGDVRQRRSASSPRQIGRKSEWKPPLCHNATVCAAR
jgi:hypothetical protein